MKFIINKEEMYGVLQKVLGPTTTKQNFPIFNSVLITSQDNKLKLVTTDLDITIIAFVDAKVEKQGQIAVPMNRLLSIVKEFPPCDILVEKVNNNLLIRCEKIEFKITTVNAEDFPKIEEQQKTTFIRINPEILEETIKLTSFCVGQEDVKYVLNGILFEIYEDNLRLVATDGKRLAFIQKKLPANQPEVKKKLSFILSLKSVQELYKLIRERNEDVFLFVEENRVGFDFQNIQFISRPIEGEFPQYESYILPESKNKLKINKRNLLLALRRAELLATPDYKGVSFDIRKNEVQISKNTPHLGEVKELVDAQYSGGQMQIGFNPTFLMDVLKSIDDEEVIFDFFGPDKPAVMRRDGYVYLVASYKI